MARKELGKKHQVSGSSKSYLPISDICDAVSISFNNYKKNLSPRAKLIDIFLVFLVALGVLQFLYVFLIGNFPFNAFLGGFISCVGQFVLTVSLRMQFLDAEAKQAESNAETSEELVEEKEKTQAYTISPVRSFGDFIFSSLILHFTVLHFIN